MFSAGWPLGRPDIAETGPDDPGRAAAGQLTCLDATRGIAATLVVLYHVARHLDQAIGAPLLRAGLQFGHAGVDVFFVLSGFIILHVHQTDIGRPARCPRYASRRLTRLMPTYWVVLALTVLLGLAHPHVSLSGWRLAASVIPGPSWAEMILGGAWSLQHELLFYTLFAALILNRAIGTALFALWLALILATGLGALPDTILPPQLGSAYNLELFLGMAAAWVLRRRALPYPRLRLAAGLGGFASAALCEDIHILDGYAPAARLAYGLASLLIVLSLVELEWREALQAPKVLRSLGQASYAIYLFQFLLIGAAWHAWQALFPPATLPVLVPFTLLGTTATLGGLAASRWIEQPLIRAFRPSGRTTPRRLSHPWRAFGVAAPTQGAPVTPGQE